MAGLVEWFGKVENSFFVLHLLAIIALAAAAESLAPQWTMLAYPALILIVSASFMWNYPVSAIKNHGLFAEFAIDLRLLWLVIAGLLSEFVLFQVFEKTSTNMLPVAGLAVGLAIAFLARNRLQERLVKARGFK